MARLTVRRLIFLLMWTPKICPMRSINVPTFPRAHPLSTMILASFLA
jgi:hypothetical protein